MVNYIMDREKLKEVLLGHKTFIALKCKKLMSEGVDVAQLTYRETDKFTDEYINTIIKRMPVETMLDDVDKVLSMAGLKNSKTYLKEEDERNKRKHS